MPWGPTCSGSSLRKWGKWLIVTLLLSSHQILGRSVNWSALLLYHSVRSSASQSALEEHVRSEEISRLCKTFQKDFISNCRILHHIWWIPPNFSLYLFIEVNSLNSDLETFCASLQTSVIVFINMQKTLSIKNEMRLLIGHKQTSVAKANVTCWGAN